MKKLFFVLSVFSSVLSAVEITVVPRSPWKSSGDREYSIDFDGGKSWPALRIKPAALRPNTYCRLTFDARDSSRGAVKTQAGFQYARNGKNTTCYLPWRGDIEYTPVVLYFKTGDTASANLFFNINPGPAAKVSLRNITLTELSLADLSVNLLPLGDFERGTSFIPYSPLHSDSLSIVPSPSFFCGEKSLKAVKAAGESPEVISSYLPAIPGKTIEVTFWARNLRDEIPAQMILDFGFPGYKNHLYRKFRFKIESEWKEFSFRYAIPTDRKAYPALAEGMVKLRIGLLKSPNAAEAWFDNIEYRLR